MKKLLLLTLIFGTSGAFAQNVEDPNCGIYVHLQYLHLYGKLVQKLESQGFHLVENREVANYLIENGKCKESGCALTEAYMIRGNSESTGEIIEIRGWDYKQFLFSRAIVANKITKKLIEVVPTCETAKTMSRLYIDIEQTQSIPVPQP